MENNTLKTYPPVARALLQKGADDLVGAVKDRIDDLLKLADSGDPKFIGDDERKDDERKLALIGIRKSLPYFCRNLEWVFCDNADDLYYLLNSVASGSAQWTTKGLKRVHEVLNRYSAEVE